MLTPAHWASAIATLLAVMACVLLHYEVLNGLDRLLLRIHAHWRRPRLLVLMFSLILLHIVEIWIFGLGYWWLSGDADGGMLQLLNGSEAGRVHFESNRTRPTWPTSVRIGRRPGS